MRKLIVRPAEPQDFVTINQLRQEFYDSRGAPVQERPPETTWFVCVTEPDDEVVGCYSYIDYPEHHFRLHQDSYRAKGITGSRALQVMRQREEADAITADLDLSGMVEPYNNDWRTWLEQNGYEVIGIQYLKKLRINN